MLAETNFDEEFNSLPPLNFTLPAHAHRDEPLRLPDGMEGGSGHRGSPARAPTRGASRGSTLVRAPTRGSSRPQGRELQEQPEPALQVADVLQQPPRPPPGSRSRPRRPRWARPPPSRAGITTPASPQSVQRTLCTPSSLPRAPTMLSTQLEDDGASFCGGSKPRLLLDMEHHLAQELGKVAQGNTAERLRAYRGCLALFISRSKVYGPLLSTVMREYDRIVAQYDEVSTRAKRVEVALQRRKIAADETLFALEQERTQLGNERDRVHGAHATELALRDKQLLEAQEEVHNLRLRVSQLQQEKKEEEGRVGTLVHAVREVETRGRLQQEKLLRLQKENRKVLHIAELFQQAKAELEDYQKSMKGCVPLVTHERTRKELTEALEQVHELVLDKGRLRSHLKNKSQEHERASRELRNTREELAVYRQESGAFTPRPAWADLMKGLPAGATMGSKSSARLGRELRQAVDDKQRLADELQAELADVRYKLDLLGGEQAAALASGSISDVGGNDDYFVGRGTAPHIPKCLRWHGRLANRRLGKAEVEELIRNCWLTMAEAEADGEGQSPPPSLGDHLHVCLLSRCGDAESAAEMAYSLRDGCQRYRKDPDCSAFLRILDGELPERVHTDQQKLLSVLQGKMLPLERQGKVRKKAIVDNLPKWFPVKTQANLNRLVAALSKDAPGSAVELRQLFAEDSEGTQGAFVESVRIQFLEESTEYITELARSIAMSAVTDASGDVHITSEGAREAVLRVDPQKPDELLKCMVRAGMGLAESADIEPSATADVDVFVRRLVKCGFERSTKKAAAPVRKKSGLQATVVDVAAPVMDGTKGPLTAADAAENIRRRSTAFREHHPEVRQPDGGVDQDRAGEQRPEEDAGEQQPAQQQQEEEGEEAH
eukprot:TRINITY_DN4565_c1_g5_i1.p1 TRINITY_DN4565_c1_g5~~TRINITY_DN4565_c1_g5_i1.p1  ORF type:complete len:891 (+),score=378.71 TRINITY_DN4565_c1_g5_i1:63-2735(+)